MIEQADMAGDWRNDPNVVFDVQHRAADEWRTVERPTRPDRTSGKQQTGNTNGKSVNGGEPRVDSAESTRTSTEVCWGCNTRSYLPQDCSNPAKAASKKDQSARSRAEQVGNRLPQRVEVRKCEGGRRGAEQLLVDVLLSQ